MLVVTSYKRQYDSDSLSTCGVFHKDCFQTTKKLDLELDKLGHFYCSLAITNDAPNLVKCQCMTNKICNLGNKFT